MTVTKKREILAKLNRLGEYIEESSELPTLISGYNGQFFIEHHIGNESDIHMVNVWIECVMKNTLAHNDLVNIMERSNRLWRHLNALKD